MKKLTKRKTNEKKDLTEIEFRQPNWWNWCQFLSPSFSWISATWISKYQNYIRFVSFSLFFYLYFGITNTENCISPHLAKKLCTVYINLINSNFYNIELKDSQKGTIYNNFDIIKGWKYTLLTNFEEEKNDDII